MSSKHLKSNKGIFLLILLVLFLLFIAGIFYIINNKKHKSSVDLAEKFPQELENSNIEEINDILNTAR